MPRRMFSYVSISKCVWSSVSSSPSRCRLRKRPRKRAPKIRSHSTSGSFSTTEKACHERGHALPTPSFCEQLLAPRTRQRVKLRLAVIFRSAPLGSDPATLLEPQQGGIKRALVELEQVFRDLLDTLGNAIAVQRAYGVKGLQNNEVECALQNFSAGRSHVFSFR